METVSATSQFGVYLYGISGFPIETWNASNYWVDVVIETTVVPNTIPPNVSSESLSSGAIDVSTGIPVSATISEAMDATTTKIH